MRAGEHEQAISYLARASRRARKMNASDASLGYINQALDVVKQLIHKTSDERERVHREKQRDDLLDAQAKRKKDVAQMASNGTANSASG